ncbi:MAG: DUF1816 domain-containing protein [Leptolyngbyaceae cyanobacterium SM2_5_2]|nr:DUF1816 domain-containing protein [Leptolyngbyaceae cyanobacterium SM2_5_2]
MKDIWLNLKNLVSKNWWIEVTTSNPNCTYYFGPFDTAQEAESMQLGYLEDLLQEETSIMQVIIKQCQPKALTILAEQKNLPSTENTTRLDHQILATQGRFKQ